MVVVTLFGVPLAYALSRSTFRGTALLRTAVDLPIVIRLTGTNEELAVEILEGAGFSALTDMDDAVQKAVQLAQEAV